MRPWTDFDHARVNVVNGRVRAICKYVRGRTLEVGCNEGFVTAAIIQECGVECVPVDNNPEAIRKAKEFFGLDVVNADANALPFEDGSFDTVVAGELLEHVPNPGAVLSELFRVSRGNVILTLPIGAYWLGEPTHLYELNGGVVDHDDGAFHEKHKHVFVVQFDARRHLNKDGSISEAKKAE